MVQRALTWLYRRLGSSYPFAFIVLELQTAWVIALATLGLFSLYYDAPLRDFALIDARFCQFDHCENVGFGQFRAFVLATAFVFARGRLLRRHDPLLTGGCV